MEDESQMYEDPVNLSLFNPVTSPPTFIPSLSISASPAVPVMESLPLQSPVLEDFMLDH